jgi:uncharacterized membrane protein (UPF0182 family)
VPINNSFLYVQPIFVISSGAVPIPELKRVVVVHGGNVSVASSLADALAASLGQAAPPPPGQPPPPTNATVAQLLQEALLHFQNAQAALQRGDLAGYQREVDLARSAIQRALQLQGRAPAPSPSPSPSLSPSPSPSG